MRRVGKTRAALLVVLMIGSLALGPSPTPTPDPYTIFDKARAQWERQHYPASLQFTVAVNVVEGGISKVEHYASYYDAVNNVITTDCVSDYERAHPPSGRGIKFNFTSDLGIGRGQPRQRLINIPIGHSANAPIDYLGVPELAPNYSFGIAPFVPSRPMTSAELVAKIRAEFHDPARATPTPAPTAASSGLHQIALVTAHDRPYRIELVGIEPMDGAPAYHLTLQPVTDPKRYRLRDLWIDTQTYVTRQLVSAGDFERGPWPGAPWTVRFAQIGGATYIVSERSAQRFSYGNLVYTGQTHVDMEDVRVPTGRVLAPICQPASDNILSEPVV